MSLSFIHGNLPLLDVNCLEKVSLQVTPSTLKLSNLYDFSTTLLQAIFHSKGHNFCNQLSIVLRATACLLHGHWLTCGFPVMTHEWCFSVFLVRVLLFSQMTSLMTILEDYFNWKGTIIACGTSM